MTIYNEITEMPREYPPDSAIFYSTSGFWLEVSIAIILIVAIAWLVKEVRKHGLK